ncbi:MAG: hypothetical protein Q7K40_05365 [bacterium]|nr:hypothetical protein [bacterium]
MTTTTPVVVFVPSPVSTATTSTSSSTVPLLTGSTLTIPDSEEYYVGASTTDAFVATETYLLNIMDTSTPYTLWGSPRAYDFSGNVPFVNPLTGKADPAQFQYWDTALGVSVNLNGDMMTNMGAPGKVDKQKNINGDDLTMVRYNEGDGITAGKCRTQVTSYAIPPRTHVRWDLNVAFGAEDPQNIWTLTPTGTSPVLFWQVKSPSQGNPPLAAIVDTDSQDPTKLMIFFSLRVGTATSPQRIAEVHGLSRNTLIPIVIEAFLDERATVDGGKGALRISVNNVVIKEMTGPTLALGTGTHNWSMDMYLYNEPLPYKYTRASFWKTARMLVFPKPTP